MNDHNYPALTQFLGAYLHQDFMLEYGSPDEAISAFISSESPESIHAACNELEQVISHVEGLDDPENFLWRVLGCYYMPKADGVTVADWLKLVRARCENSAHDRGV